MRSAGVVCGACLAALLLFYFACLNYLEPTEVGISWNLSSGKMELQNPGWHLTSPMVQVARVDTQPMRVCITSASRAFNCKLAQFVPHEYKLFVDTEGFYYYWWYNRFSFNWGYGDEYRGVKDIIRGYAYSTKQYPFVITLRDYESGQ